MHGDTADGMQSVSIELYYAEERQDALPYEQAQDILGIVKDLGGNGNIS